MSSALCGFLKQVTRLAGKEPFLVIFLILTVFLSFFSLPHFSAIHWNVVVTLFSLMLVSAAFDSCGLLSSFSCLALGCFKTPKKLGFAMILTTGLLSMFLTNDVALLTVVPLTISMAKLSGNDPGGLIVLETLSANIFSAMTPFGNPQNLYLYSYYRLSPAVFFAAMLPFCLFGGAVLFAFNLIFSRGDEYMFQPAPFMVHRRKLLVGAAFVFLLNLLSVLGLVDYRIVLVLSLAVFLLLEPRLFQRVDYCLLLTFLLFFLFTDSATGIGPVRRLLSGMLRSKTAVLFISALLSQIISNVPAAVFVSGFTTHAKELLFGVSAGGFGTLVASLASLISYKLYAHEYNAKGYLRLFYRLNFAMLLLLLAGVTAAGLL